MELSNNHNMEIRNETELVFKVGSIARNKVTRPNGSIDNSELTRIIRGSYLNVGTVPNRLVFSMEPLEKIVIVYIRHADQDDDVFEHVCYLFHISITQSHN